MSERAELEAHRATLRAKLAALTETLARRKAEVDAALANHRAERDAKLAETLALEREAAEASERLRTLRGALAEALRDEDAARNHLHDLKRDR